MISNSSKHRPNKVPNTTHQQISSPDITSVSSILCNNTHGTPTKVKALGNIYYFSHKHTHRLTTRKQTEDSQKKLKMQYPHTAGTTLANVILQAEKHHIPTVKMHKVKGKLLPEHIRRKIKL